jgi:hypothetical protein
LREGYSHTLITNAVEVSSKILILGEESGQIDLSAVLNSSMGFYLKQLVTTDVSRARLTALRQNLRAAERGLTRRHIASDSGNVAFGF